MNLNAETAKMIVVMVGILIAALCDWKARKIPNALTFSMLGLGLILHIWGQGLSGAGVSLLGFVCGILLLYVPFSLGGVGGGDVKLLGAIGSLVGPQLVLHIFLASAVFGGIFSLITMVRGKAVRKTLQNIKNKALYFLLTRKWMTETVHENEEKTLGIPYACAIGCGTLLILFVLKGG